MSRLSIPTPNRAQTVVESMYRDVNKCIKCMRCVQICDKVQSLSVWDVSGSCSRTTIDVSGNRVMKESDRGAPRTGRHRKTADVYLLLLKIRRCGRFIRNTWMHPVPTRQSGCSIVTTRHDR